MMKTKKFWCHYIGNDGNTPKRRNIELTDISELLPNVSNEGVETPVWFEKQDKYYQFYAVLSDNIAVSTAWYVCLYDNENFDYLKKSDEEIDRDFEQHIAEIYGGPSLIKMTDEKVAENKAAWKRIYDGKKHWRDEQLAKISHLQNYDNLLLSGSQWISIAILRAYEEVKSPILSGLKELRKIAMEKRETEQREREEQRRKQAEEEARKKAETEAKEQERLTQEAEKFKNGESIAGCDVVDLCRRFGINIHLRTVHNLQQVVCEINGKNETCQYWKGFGKRRPQLDGCYKTAKELYNYLQEH